MKTSKPIYIISAIIFLYSIVVMAGWIFGLEALTTISSNTGIMKFPTALCFFLASISLYFMEKATAEKKVMAQIFVPGSTLAIGIIMTTLLATGFFGGNTGLENLFTQVPLTSQTLATGIPAIPTMIGFILFCIASTLALFRRYKVKKYLQLLGCCISLIGLAAIFGYVFHFPLLYLDIPSSVGSIAVNTATLFVFLGIGVMYCGYQNNKDALLYEAKL